MDSPLSQYSLLKRLFFLPLSDLGTFVENQLQVDVWVYLRTPDSIPLLYVSIPVPVSQCLACCYSVVTKSGNSLEMGLLGSPKTFLTFPVAASLMVFIAAMVVRLFVSLLQSQERKMGLRHVKTSQTHVLVTVQPFFLNK